MAQEKLSELHSNVENARLWSGETARWQILCALLCVRQLKQVLDGTPP